MKAWEVRDGVMSLHELPAARPRPGEVAVDVSRVGICGSDFTLAIRLIGRHAASVSQLITQNGELDSLPTILANQTTRSVRAALTAS